MCAGKFVVLLILVALTASMRIPSLSTIQNSTSDQENSIVDHIISRKKSLEKSTEFSDFLHTRHYNLPSMFFDIEILWSTTHVALSNAKLHLMDQFSVTEVKLSKTYDPENKDLDLLELHLAMQAGTIKIEGNACFQCDSWLLPCNGKAGFESVHGNTKMEIIVHITKPKNHPFDEGSTIDFKYCKNDFETDEAKVTLHAESLIINAGSNFINRNPELFVENIKPNVQTEINQVCRHLIENDAFGMYDRDGVNVFIAYLEKNFPIEKN